MRREESSDHLRVLLGLETAGGIDDPSTRPDPLSRVGEEANLDGRHALEFVGIQTPPQLHPSAQHAGIGAGGVHEDAVKFRRRGGQGRDNRDTGDAEPGGVLGEQGEASLRRVVGHDSPRISHALRGEEGLAPGRGTEVEDRFPRTRVELMDRQEGTGVLQVESAVPEAPKVGDSRDS